MHISADHGKAPEQQHILPIRLVTFNVRYATKIPVPGERLWPERCPKLCAQLRFLAARHGAAFLCLQEALHEQVRDIHAQLGGEGGGHEEWSYIGCGRDDGGTRGEYAPIFYSSRTWHCEASRVYWLSETPEKPSRGWDAVLNRIVTVGRFRHRATSQAVVIMSTHFDHVGVQARQESARLILRISDAWRSLESASASASASSFTFSASPTLTSTSSTLTPASSSTSTSIPLFLGGDFNSSPDDGAYQTITASPGGMLDLSTQVPPDRQYGNPVITYTSFGEPDEEPQRIDFLFAKADSALHVSSFSILANRFDDGVFLSDHRAVVADVDWVVTVGLPETTQT